jgi:hypothetical protein
MKTGTSSLMDGKDYQQRKVMRIDDVNEMADSNIRENEQVEKLAGDYALNRGVSKGIEQRMIDGFMAGYNKAKETLYTEEQVLQLLLRLQQTESYDNLYEWFEQFKK